MASSIACVGAGPAGLYLAILAKRAAPARRVTVFERQPEGATLGWGVTLFLDDLLSSDARTAHQVGGRAFCWQDSVVHVAGRNPIAIPGANRGHSIGRKALLAILIDRARELDVELRFGQEIESASELADYELIVAADGIHSSLRDCRRDEFGTRCERGSNKYVWLGTTRVFNSFAFPFVHTPAGWLWAFAYGFDDTMSTFIVETSARTWSLLGFDQLGADATLRRLEALFAPWLQGHALQPPAGARDVISWLEFTTISNARWYADNLVLVGDSAHTAHFTIGHGTQLAIADAISLAHQLSTHAQLDRALGAYEAERKAAIAETQAYARNSASWFENVARYIAYDDDDFAALLFARGSSLLPRLPPPLFLALRSAALHVPAFARPARRVWQALRGR